MRTSLHHACFNHGAREAVAQCPECRRFFCRECVTEHDDRVVCAACLRKLGSIGPAARVRFAGLAGLMQGLTGALVAWLFFYWLGEALLRLPSSFHDGTLWKAPWADHR